MPSVGNGFSAFEVGSDSIYIAGVFNGFRDTAPSHRARVPNGMSISFPFDGPRVAALDIERAVYYRRSVHGQAKIEQRWYFHDLFFDVLL